MPVLRIEVEGVKHAIVQHLAAGREEWTRAAIEEVERFDIEQAVRVEVRRLLPTLIHDAIVNAISGTQKEIEAEVREALRPQIQKSLAAVWDSVD